MPGPGHIIGSMLIRKFRKKKIISALFVSCGILILGNLGKFNRNSGNDYKLSHPNGYVNALWTKRLCREIGKTTESFSDTITVRWNRNKTVLYCPVYKVATTFWRRVFMINTEKKYENKTTPYDLPFDLDYKSDKFNLEAHSSNAHAHFNFMFSRHPYDRLFSVYVDKLMAPNPYFWNLIGIPAITLSRPGPLPKNIKCGHDVTFREFIHYVVYKMENNLELDAHILPMYKNCQPCRMSYDFIGTMENFRQDSHDILRTMNMRTMAAILNATGNELAAIDAIKDSLSQPFTFRSKYWQCMSLEDAVKRAWRKLMMRGLIASNEYELNYLNDLVINKRSFNKLVDHALLVRKASSVSDRRLSKCKLKRDLWSQIGDKLMDKLKKLYAKDFFLFRYSNSTDVLQYC